MIQVAGLFLDLQLLPYAGTLALAALLGAVLARPTPAGGRPWPQRAAIAGLAALTLLAAVVDARTGGYGWPAELNRAPGLAVFVESGLLAVAGILLSIAALTGIRRPIRWWRYLPIAAVGLLFVIGLVDQYLRDQRFTIFEAPPDPVALAAALALPCAAVLLLIAAVNLALTAGPGLRRTGAALLPLLVLSLGGISAVWDEDALRREPAPADCAAADPADTIAGCRNAFLEPGYRLRPGAPPGFTASVTAAQLSALMVRAEQPDRRSSSTADDVPAIGDIPAVTAAPAWSADVWASRTDWDRSLPALLAAVLLLALLTLAAGFFPDDGGPEAPAP